MERNVPWKEMSMVQRNDEKCNDIYIIHFSVQKKPLAGLKAKWLIKSYGCYIGNLVFSDKHGSYVNNKKLSSLKPVRTMW